MSELLPQVKWQSRGDGRSGMMMTDCFIKTTIFAIQIIFQNVIIIEIAAS